MSLFVIKALNIYVLNIEKNNLQKGNLIVRNLLHNLHGIKVANIINDLNITPNKLI